MASTTRDPWLDNAKLWLVVLVVIGHAIVLIPPSDLRSQSYDFIYLFHIPVFVMISGHLSRRFRWTRRHLTSLVTTLLVPYVIFELLMACFRVYVVDEVGSLSDLSPLWLNPHWPMWYLIVLALWRLATPILVRHWVMVPLAVVVSLVAGQWNIELLDLNRALGLLPFFVIGLHLRSGVLTALRARWTPLLGIGVLVALWQVAARTDDLWSTQWLYYRSPYADLTADFGDGPQTRAMLLLLGLLGSLAVLTLVPRGRSGLTALGGYTMGVYLVHGFVIRYAESVEYGEWLPTDEYAALAVTVLAATALALLLAARPLRIPIGVAVDPVGAIRRRRQAKQEAGPQ